MLEALFHQLVKSDGINEQGTENAIHHVIGDASISQSEPVDAIPRDGVLMLWLQNDTWNVKVLCILECFVNPRFKNFGIHFNSIISIS